MNSLITTSHNDDWCVVNGTPKLWNALTAGISILKKTFKIHFILKMRLFTVPVSFYINIIRFVYF